MPITFISVDDFESWHFISLFFEDDYLQGNFG
jgi:hypothetical protein